MNGLPSTSKTREPPPRSMNSGSPPTDLNARTGLFTPPGIRPEALSINLAERSMASSVLASTLSPLPCKRASPLSLRLFKVYNPGPVPAVTELTSNGESVGYPHLLSAAPVQAKPGDDEQSYNGHRDCAHYGPEHLSGHEATWKYADVLQQPNTANEGHQPSCDQQHVAHTVPPIVDPELRPCAVRRPHEVRGIWKPEPPGCAGCSPT